MSADVIWDSGPLDGFTPRALYRVLRARQAVFVVEQRCIYLDADALDERCWHLVGWLREPAAASTLAQRDAARPGGRADAELDRGVTAAGFDGARGNPSAVDPGVVVAYARLLPPGLQHAEAAIGRVLTLGVGRGVGLGDELMRRAVAATETRWPGSGIRLSAQAHLQAWYARHGFVAEGDVYDEDGIAHRSMHRGVAK